MAWSYSHDPLRINVNDTTLLSYQETESEIKMVFSSFTLCSPEGFRINRDRCKLSYLKKHTSETDTIPRMSEVIDFAMDDHHHRFMLLTPNSFDDGIINLNIHFSQCSFVAESNTFGEPFNYGDQKIPIGQCACGRASHAIPPTNE